MRYERSRRSVSSIVCTDTRSPVLKRSFCLTRPGRVWVWIALAARYRTLFSRSLSRSKMLWVAIRISPITAPAASSSANEGSFSGAGAFVSLCGDSRGGPVSCAAAGVRAHAAIAKQAKASRSGTRDCADREMGPSNYLTALSESVRYLVSKPRALRLRVAESRGPLEAAAIPGHDLAVPDVDHHRISGVEAPRIALVDHHAHGPAVLALAREGVSLVERSGPGLDLDQRESGVVHSGLEIVAHDLLVVLRTRSVVERGDLLGGERRRLTRGEQRKCDERRREAEIGRASCRGGGEDEG